VRIPDNVATIVDLLEAKNISWAGYFEGIPSPGYMGNWSVSSKDEGWDYVRKHKYVCLSHNRRFPPNMH
jgi:acid phosphatase